MSRDDDRRHPWILWPFVALWRLLTGILELTGRLVAVVLGLVLMIVGGLLTATRLLQLASAPYPDQK